MVIRIFAGWNNSLPGQNCELLGLQNPLIGVPKQQQKIETLKLRVVLSGPANRILIFFVSVANTRTGIRPANGCEAA